MRNPLPDRRRAERFAQLLDEADGGRRQRLRTPYDDELAGLVALRQQLADQSPGGIDPDFRAGLRAMLVAQAERDESATTTPEPAQPAVPARSRPALWSRGPRTRTAAAVGVAIGAVAFAGISTASDDAVPGHPLYGVKRSTERAQLALASSDLGRGQLYLGFAQTRLSEASALASDVARVLDDMDRDTGQGVRLLTTAAVHQQDAAALDVIDQFVSTQRGTLRQLANHVSGADREQVEESLQLLTEVEERSAQLRERLDQGCDSATADSLGPLPGSCGALAAVPARSTSVEQVTVAPSDSLGQLDQAPQSAGTGPGTAADRPSGTDHPDLTSAGDADGSGQPARDTGGDGLLHGISRLVDDLLGD